MHNADTIMALVDEHAKDMLRRFGGTNVDPDKSRAAVKRALEEVLPSHLDVTVITDPLPQSFHSDGVVPPIASFITPT